MAHWVKKLVTGQRSSSSADTPQPQPAVAPAPAPAHVPVSGSTQPQRASTDPITQPTTPSYYNYRTTGQGQTTKTPKNDSPNVGVLWQPSDSPPPLTMTSPQQTVFVFLFAKAY